MSDILQMEEILKKEQQTTVFFPSIWYEGIDSSSTGS